MVSYVSHSFVDAFWCVVLMNSLQMDIFTDNLHQVRTSAQSLVLWNQQWHDL